MRGQSTVLLRARRRSHRRGWKWEHSENVLSHQEALRHRSDFHRYTQRRKWTLDTVSLKKKKKSKLGRVISRTCCISPQTTAGPLSCVSSDPPSYDEILLALHKLKNNKAGGTDGLPLELFRRGAPTVCQPLQELFSLIWLHQKIPDDWNIAVIILCYKKGNKESEMLQLPWNQLDRHCHESS